MSINFGTTDYLNTSTNPLAIPPKPKYQMVVNGVSAVCVSAFNNACTGLTSLAIGNSTSSEADVLSVNAYAFNGCNNLSALYLGSTISSIGQNAFGSCPSTCTVMVAGKTKAQVSAIPNYPWGITKGCVISCSDGNLTV